MYVGMSVQGTWVNNVTIQVLAGLVTVKINCMQKTSNGVSKLLCSST